MSGGRATRSALVGLVVLTAVVAVALLAVVLLAVEVRGGSMAPSLADGDRVLVAPAGDGTGLARGDAVVVDVTDTPAVAVKWLVGLPGDRVRIRLPERGPVVELQVAGVGEWQVVQLAGWAAVPGRAAGPGVPCCSPAGLAAPDGAAATVPRDSVWVLGEDPLGSVDSRSYGFVPLADVRGRVALRVWPLGSLGRLTPPPLG